MFSEDGEPLLPDGKTAAQESADTIRMLGCAAVAVLAALTLAVAAIVMALLL